jgi:hypothetical protein
MEIEAVILFKNIIIFMYSFNNSIIRILNILNQTMD